ncbi:MAG: endonuclease [Bradymonadia bacterium]
MTRFPDPLFWRAPYVPWVLFISVLTMTTMGCQRKVPSQIAETEKADTRIVGNDSLTSFRLAKKKVYQINAMLSRTFYCGCTYHERWIAKETCAFETTRFAKRATRTEVEHIVPVHAFGQSFTAWRDGDAACVDRKGQRYRGRRCATKVVPLFRRMSADLYNLRPVVGALNALRSNLRMGEVEGEAREFGGCNIEIEAGVFEPPDEIKGDVARTYLYMDSAYPGHGILGRKQRKLMNAWHRLDPVSDGERRWAKAVKAIQGNVNPYITGERQ